MMALTRREKEKLVSELYNQGKTYREIAEEVRICPRDIKTILNKVVKEKESQESISVSSQAYKLFSEGKSPIDVAIALNLRDAQVTELYKEYWNLYHLHDLNQVYEEIKGDIVSFLHLYKSAKSAGMNAQQVIRLLRVSNIHLPAVEQRYQELKREETFLKAGNHNSARTLQELSDLISTTQNTLEQYELSCKQRGLEIKNLNKEYTALQELVNAFQNNNEDYIKITTAVEEKVVSILSNAEVLLRNALLSIIESITNNPERFRLIFYNMPSITDCYNSDGQDYTASYMYGGRIQQSQQYQLQDYNTEANVAIIVDEAQKLFNKLVKDSINKIITDCTFSKSSSSLPLTDKEE